MTSILHYGSASTVEFDLSAENLVAACDAPRGDPLDDPAAAVAAAMVEPLDFPPLARSTMSGDRVAIVPDEAVPQAGAVIAGVVQALLECGIEPDDIAIVRAESPNRENRVDPRDQLPANLAKRVTLVDHDPDDRDQLSYLAASGSSEAVYLNRTLYDVDLVLPIGCLRLASSAEYRGTHGGLFPAFSDRETIERFRAPSSLESSGVQQKRRKEVDEVGWLLGAAMTIQVVPGGGDRVLHVLAGDVKTVGALGEKLCEQAWRYSVPRRASLVIATVEGGPALQTWDNVARALSAASQCVEPDGAIAVCTDLAIEPGAALRRLGGSDDRAEVLSEIRRERLPDAWPAAELAHALERGPVYLLSRLEEEVVEQLGIAPAANPEEIGRLATRYTSCLLLGNAQHAVAVVDES